MMCSRDDDPSMHEFMASYWIASWRAVMHWATSRTMRRYAVREWWG